jgi:hypothetical protein
MTHPDFDTIIFLDNLAGEIGDVAFGSKPSTPAVKGTGAWANGSNPSSCVDQPHVSYFGQRRTNLHDPHAAPGIECAARVGSSEFALS